MELLNELVGTVRELWPHIVATISLVLMVVATAHVVMYKKDTRAAIGWAGVILMSPILGALVYSVLGINRIQHRAVNLRARNPRYRAHASRHLADRDAVIKVLPADARHLASLENLISHLTGRPLLGGNRVAPLVGGAEAYPQMIAAINEAHRSVALSSYIFDNDRAGQMFATALAGAVERGVAVRVLIDSIGARYTFPSIIHSLRRLNVPVAQFLPTLVPGRFAYSNLRNHRKILVTDGRLAFTGGLNIREGHDASLNPAHPILDHHFRIDGPVVAQIQEVFAEDWAFSTNELLSDDTWFPELEPTGNALRAASRPDLIWISTSAG